jgi:hypothetical protein
MSISYTWEKLHSAVANLATSSHDLPTRLAEAYVYSLMRLEPKDFPANLQERFQQLVNQITQWEPQGDAGLIPVVATHMAEDEARRLIGEVVSLYDEIARNLPDNYR